MNTPSDPMSSMVVIQVYEWAKYDISNAALQKDLVHSETRLPTNPCCGSTKETVIEDSHLCTQAEEIACQQDPLFTADGSDFSPARRDDHISFY